MRFGTETEVTHQGDVTTKIRVEKHNGGETRRLKITEESIRVENKKDILNKVMEAWAKHERGEIVGFGIDATIYKPKTLAIDRIVVTTVSLLAKGEGNGEIATTTA